MSAICRMVQVVCPCVLCLVLCSSPKLLYKCILRWVSALTRGWFDLFSRVWWNSPSVCFSLSWLATHSSTGYHYTLQMSVRDSLFNNFPHALLKHVLYLFVHYITFWSKPFLQQILILKQQGTCLHSLTLGEFWVSTVVVLFNYNFAWRLWGNYNDACINMHSSKYKRCLMSVLTFFIPGGILAGLVSDYTGGRASTCCAMLIAAAPMVSVSVIAWVRITQITQCAHHWF